MGFDSPCKSASVWLRVVQISGEKSWKSYLLILSNLFKNFARLVCRKRTQWRCVSTILAEKTDFRKAQMPGSGDEGQLSEFIRELELRMAIKLGVMVLVGMAAVAAIVKLL